MKKWIPTLVVAFVLVLYIWIDQTAEQRASRQAIQSFPMQYLKNYIDSSFMERFKDLDLTMASVHYHNFLLREEMPGKYSRRLDNINRVLSGVEGDTMLQYGMDENDLGFPMDSVVIDSGRIIIYPSVP